MELVFLGCGTSTGVPIVGCDCEVCRSDNPRNQRSRTSAFIALDNGCNILIDTAPDLRRQGLDNGLTHIDAVFYTHTHADHTHGIDELRIYNFLQRVPIDIYGATEHLEHIRRKFSYIFEASVQRGGGKPNLVMHEVVPGESFELFDETVTPVKLLHGRLRCLGWRIGSLAYLTDLSAIPDESYPLLEGLDLLVLGALRWQPHQTHYTIEEAFEQAEKIGAGRCVLTHMGHEVDYEEVCRRAPDFVEPAYDGLRIKI